MEFLASHLPKPPNWHHPRSPQAHLPLRSSDLLALFIQQVEKRGGLLADQVDAGAVVYVVDVVPGDAL